MSKNFTYFILLYGVLFAFKAESKTYLGLFEDKAVRHVFTSTEQKWQSALVDIKDKRDLGGAARKYATPKSWNIFSRTNKYSPVRVKPFARYKNVDQNGLQQVISKEPKWGDRKDEEYLSWNRAKVRPVLVSNLDSLEDPQNWQRLHLEISNKNLMTDLLNRAGEVIMFCRGAECESEFRRSLKENELEQKLVYQDHRQNYLVAYAFHFPEGVTARCSLGDGLDCRNAEYFWYYLDRSGKFNYLGPAAAFVEAADVTGDLISDFIFYRVAGGFTGYELFDGATKKSLALARWPVKL